MQKLHLKFRTKLGKFGGNFARRPKKLLSTLAGCVPSAFTYMSRRLPHTKKIVPQIIIRIYVALGLLSLFDIKIVLYLHFHAIVFDQKFPVKRRLFTPHVFAKAGLCAARWSKEEKLVGEF